MTRKQRLDMIAGLLSDEHTGSQLKLQELLEERGVVVSQSSLSRDLNALGAFRMQTQDGSFVYRLAGEERRIETSLGIKRRFQISVTGVASSGNIVIVYTNPAEAQAIARVLDCTDVDGLLGTVAGDNTVMCVVSDEGTAIQLRGIFNGYLE